MDGEKHRLNRVVNQDLLCLDSNAKATCFELHARTIAAKLQLSLCWLLSTPGAMQQAFPLAQLLLDSKGLTWACVLPCLKLLLTNEVLRKLAQITAESLEPGTV